MRGHCVCWDKSGPDKSSNSYSSNVIFLRTFRWRVVAWFWSEGVNVFLFLRCLCWYVCMLLSDFPMKTRACCRRKVWTCVIVVFVFMCMSPLCVVVFVLKHPLPSERTAMKNYVDALFLLTPLAVLLTLRTPSPACRFWGVVNTPHFRCRNRCFGLCPVSITRTLDSVCIPQ